MWLTAAILRFLPVSERDFVGRCPCLGYCFWLRHSSQRPRCCTRAKPPLNARQGTSSRLSATREPPQLSRPRVAGNRLSLGRQLRWEISRTHSLFATHWTPLVAASAIWLRKLSPTRHSHWPQPELS